MIIDSRPGTLTESKKPNRTCILNFNYTNIAKLYNDSNGGVWDYIPIHGQLEGDDVNIQSPVFGFGDEIDQAYEGFELLRNDDLYKHIKSFKYLQFSHYRKLLEFIGSEPYQVQIYGHSCGVSNRTLLNTIFESENCISIKPFYYQVESGDDFEKLSFSISRHFTSKAELRAKVVNKEYCEPMLQPLKKSITK
jgi:hypothetical protein